ncbi:hypothetical protein BC940DRAFT_319042 [Gongronella butleri]|nr:hypothetical protein BC940DRAFT_319042 [Gongronella butleri]
MYMVVLQKEIDDLKQQARQAYETHARLNAENALRAAKEANEGKESENEPVINEEDNDAGQKQYNDISKLIVQMEELKKKLSTSEMLNHAHNDGKRLEADRLRAERAERAPKEDKTASALFEEETMTLLHLFYIVRLAQQGFFSVIASAYPNVEPKALVHLCDKLVGGSLFVVKDPLVSVRRSKKAHVLSLLHKLHAGANEPIDSGFSTTFENIRHLITHFLESTAISPFHLYNPTSPSAPASPSNSDILPLPTTLQPNQPNQQQNQQQQNVAPVWVMVPFQGMIPDQESQPQPIKRAPLEARSSKPERGRRSSVTRSSKLSSDARVNGVSESNESKSVPPTPPPKATSKDDAVSVVSEAPSKEKKPFTTTAPAGNGSLDLPNENWGQPRTDATPLDDNWAKAAPTDDAEPQGEWGAPTTAAAAAAEADTNANANASADNEQKQDDQGWGQPSSQKEDDQPAWEGKLPDEWKTNDMDASSVDNGLASKSWSARRDDAPPPSRGFDSSSPSYRRGRGGRGGGSGPGRGFRRGPGIRQ